MHSLWEKQSFLSPDVVIVGAGITGLSAAATLKELSPDMKVTVLERGVLPTGASTKNAGFACFGSVSELLNDIDTLGPEGMVNLVEKRWDGLQKTCQRLGRSAIDIQVKSGYELILEEGSGIVEKIDNVNQLLNPFFQEDVFKLSDAKIDSFGLGQTHHLIENHLEGQLDTGRLIATLWKYCAELGVQIHTGCKVDNIIEEENGVSILCGNVKFLAEKVGVCTNAFTSKLLKEELDIAPGRGIVMSIVPDKSLPFEGTFHYEEGYYYFRDYYGKLLFGGGRNLALKEEETTEFGVNKKIREKLLLDIENIILPNQSYEIEMEWTGIMAFGQNKAPIVQKVSDRIAIGVRLGGMGVAIGSLVGEEVAELIVNS
ncbi:Glycine/D-amino acid oxidase [Ekhidna lutea]|uniref:Glycine/D-amino acid oxidase n=1 Tax=Ekhidna lutea TaxID=447679 RepID=A0A239HNW1_EKHLU|nr:FAD-dependent oxidoreductase [Ekhidna lutea]SNS82805.1 Glycine/D-amino acid oxidase [Ekhidna lutea]